MPTVITKPCEPCDGTGLISGQTCSYCEGSGEEPVALEPHDQIEWNVKYIVEKVDDIKDKVNDLKEKVDEIKEVVDAL